MSQGGDLLGLGSHLIEWIRSDTRL